jgi:hypothetical protein
MATWVTGAEASDITAKTVTDEQVTAAHPIIEIFSNVTSDASAALKPRDVRLLRYAEAYQAAWMPSQVDFTSRMDVDDVDQDGISYSKSDGDAFVLAPLAKRCILRLSWMKSRTVHPLTPEQAARLRGVLTPDLQLAGTEEWLDDRQTWEPLHGEHGGPGGYG